MHLLPYLDQFALYEQFHLDEPWDSDHNKTLISQMPKLFGDSAEGKTPIQLFVGEGTLFGTAGSFGIAEVTDGTSNTIMCVKTGDDAADFWTKPGGLALDKANPIAALGTIGETFLVVFMDGAVRSLPSNISAEDLSNLITHQDGNAVEIP